MSYRASFLGSGRNWQLWNPCFGDSLVALSIFLGVLLTVIIIRSLEVHALSSFLWMVDFQSWARLLPDLD